MGSIRSQNVVMPAKSAHTEITDYSHVYCYMHQERQIEFRGEGVDARFTLTGMKFFFTLKMEYI